MKLELLVYKWLSWFCLGISYMTLAIAADKIDNIFVWLLLLVAGLFMVAVTIKLEKVTIREEIKC